MESSMDKTGVRVPPDPLLAMRSEVEGEGADGPLDDSPPILFPNTMPRPLPDPRPRPNGPPNGPKPGLSSDVSFSPNSFARGTNVGFGALAIVSPVASAVDGPAPFAVTTSLGGDRTASGDSVVARGEFDGELCRMAGGDIGSGRLHAHKLQRCIHNDNAMRLLLHW